MGGHTEMYCFASNKFESDVVKSWRELRKDKDFCDVTLACEDDYVKAHKVILSACSPVLNKLLTENPHTHPLLYLRGVKYKELEHIVDFMYEGEVNIGQEELNSFLAMAQELKIKGLTNDEKMSDVGVKIEASPNVECNVEHESPTKQEKKETRGRKRTQKFATSPFPIAKINQSEEEEEIREPPKKAIVHNHSIFSKSWEVPDEDSNTDAKGEEDIDDVQTETSDEINIRDEEGFQFEEDPNDFEQDKYIDVAEIKKKIANSKNGLKSKDGAKSKEVKKRTSIYMSEDVWDRAVTEGKYSCEHCDYKTIRRSNFNKHVKAKHLGVRYPCIQCEYKATDQSNLNKHVKSVHNIGMLC